MPETQTVSHTKKLPKRLADDHRLEIAKQREYYIVQGNDMTQRQTFLVETKPSGKADKDDNKKRKRKALTLTEEKILNYLISQIPPNTKTLEPMVFDIKNFCEVCGLGKGNTDNYYPSVRNAAESLASKVMWLKRDDGGITTVRYIQRVTIYPKKGKILVEFDKMMEPYLLNLAGNYFQFSFHNILAMNSSYSISLYKLLKSYCFMSPVIRFEIEDLKQRLDAMNYTKLSELKSRVIIPAVDEINRYTDIAVDVEYEKTGRAVTHIIFSVQDLKRCNSDAANSEASRRYYNVERALEPDLMQQFDRFL